MLWAIFFIGLNIGMAFADPAAAKEEPRTIAVGPFFAPDANDSLRKISANMPDLLTVELSQQDGFRLVEREKVTAIWKELNLSAAGMVTAESIAHLGQVLACDWLITGTVVPGKTGTQVWAKVVDVKSSVVLDLEALPFDANNLPATIQGIASFINKAKTHRQTDQFVTLGRFTDLSTDRSREDWSQRIRTVIEQHCRDAHMGLVEREAVAPIFEEFQFQRVGLTGALTNRVRLQPAFWIIDGACKWVNDTQLKVTIRLQKVGGREQLIELIQNAGPQLESAVLATLQPLLAATSEKSNQLGLDESKLHANRGMEAANGRDRFSRFTYDLSTQSDLSRPDPQRKRDLADNRRSAIESFEKALLLNPKDVHAKYMLGYALIGDQDPDQRERGKAFLKEVVALNDPNFSKQAALYLEYPEMLYQHITVVGSTPTARDVKRAKAFQALALERAEKAFESNPTSLEAKFGFGMALINEPDGPQKKRGKEFLKEIAASTDPKFSKFAARRLESDQIAAQGGRMTPAQMAKAEKEADEAFEKAYRDNPTRVDAKLAYASILVTKNDAAKREQGKKMLREIVGLNDPKYSQNAAWYLKHGDMFIKKPNAVSTNTAATAASPSPGENRAAIMEKRIEFLQQNFSRFVPMEFEATTNSEATIHYVHVKQNLFEHEGHYYCGFQFTVPQWLDGDFEWMHILAKTETNKDLSIHGMQWYIVPKSGRSDGFEYFRHDTVASYPRLKQRFPFTKGFYVQNLAKDRLQPGKSYAIWFSFVDQNVCDIAFAMTIDSERGAKEFGVLPLR